MYVRNPNGEATRTWNNAEMTSKAATAHPSRYENRWSTSSGRFGWPGGPFANTPVTGSDLELESTTIRSACSP